MATIRVIKDKNYTVMSNRHLQDLRLSLKAVGLLSKLLSLPDDWEYSVEGLTQICREGRDAISAALKELEACGYLKRRQTHDAGGKLSGMEYLIFEAPQDAEDSPLTDNPSTVEPFTEKPSTENPEQLNTNLVNTKILNTIPPIVPQEGDGATGSRKRKRHRTPPKEQPDHLPARFNSLWKYYRHDKRGGKQAAIRAWDALAPSDALADKIAAAMKKQFATAEWQRGIGIPHVSTYLNGYMWVDADEIDEALTGTAPETNTGGDREWI